MNELVFDLLAYEEPTDSAPCIVNARKLEHGFRRIGARIPYTLYSSLRA